MGRGEWKILFCFIFRQKVMIHFLKIAGQFKPLYISDLDRWEKVKENTVYCMRAERDRNHKHHSKLFSVANDIILNLPKDDIWHDKTSYALIKASMLQLGYVEPIMKWNGEIEMQVMSLKFEKMDQTLFEEVYKRIIDLWAEKWGDWIYENEAGEF